MKKALLVLLALCMVIPAGCRKGGTSSGSDEYEYSYTSEIVEVDGENGSGNNGTTGGKNNNTTGGNNNGTTGGKDNTGTASTSKFKPKKDGIVVDNKYAGNDSDANYTAKGTVTIAVSSYRPADYEAMFDAMTKVYKDIDIVLDFRPRPTSTANGGGDAAESTDYLTARALAGNMPDVVFDDAGSIWSHVANGWVEPLDKYIANDSQFQYVPENLKLDYTFGGKLYALPHQAHFTAVVLNLTAMEALNIKRPALTWNLDDFVNVLKKGTTDVYSGCEILTSTASYLAGTYDTGVTTNGYDYRNHNFDKMATTYKKSAQLERDLEAIPGLQAYSLRFTASGGVTDYEAKFGNGNLSNMAMAYHLGKTVVHMDMGTWSYDIMDEEKFDWELFPYPQLVAGRIPFHVDCCYMLKNAKNKDAAFQVLRYMTYSTEGNLARLSMYDDANKGKYVLNSRVYYPTTHQSDVAAKFKSLSITNDVDVFWYENLSNGYRVDPIKIVPGWYEISTQVGTYMENKKGTDLDSLIPGLISHGNKYASKNWSAFETKLKAVQAKES